MDNDLPLDLEQLGREVAQRVAGPGVIADVRVEPGLTPFDEPTYIFSFLIDPHRTQQRLGLIRGGLLMGLRDGLIERGNWDRPTVQLMGRAGWERHGA